MKMVIWTVGVSLALAIVLVAMTGVITPARVRAESGARVCGYIVQPLLPGAPAQDSSVVLNVGIMVETKEDDSSTCNKAFDKIRDAIKNDPELKKYYNGDASINNTKAYNRWVYFKNATCETIGGYFGGKEGNRDPNGSYRQ